jgi:hypothetical protein
MEAFRRVDTLNESHSHPTGAARSRCRRAACANESVRLSNGRAFIQKIKIAFWAKHPTLPAENSVQSVSRERTVRTGDVGEADGDHRVDQQRLCRMNRGRIDRTKICPTTPTSVRIWP